jgi:hypothetical protein
MSHRVRPDGSIILLNKHRLDAKSSTHEDVVRRFTPSPIPVDNLDGARAAPRMGSLPPLASSPVPAASAAGRTNIDESFAAGPRALLRHDPELVAVVRGASVKTMRTRLKLQPHQLTQRDGVLLLEASMDQRLAAVCSESTEEEVSRQDSAVAAHAVLSDVAHELTRMVGAQCEERGRLLARVWLRYTDVVNAMMAAFEAEQQRNATAESRTAKQLQQVRADYATMCDHSEKMLLRFNEELDSRATEYGVRTEQLSSELRVAQSSLQRLEALVRRAVRSGDPAAVLQHVASGEPTSDTTFSPAARENANALRVRELEAKLALAEMRHVEYEKQCQRLELQVVDARAETDRLRAFLRGTDSLAFTSKVQQTSDAATTTDDLSLEVAGATATPLAQSTSPSPQSAGLSPLERLATPGTTTSRLATPHLRVPPSA